jgi:hypothetical protein
MKEADRRTRLAEIRWIPGSEGGRESPPDGVGEQPYSTVVRLLGCDETEIGKAPWSLAVEKLEEAEDADEWLAEVFYILDEAPHELLRIGRRFELYEGARCVATGVVVGRAGDRSPCTAFGDAFD